MFDMTNINVNSSSSETPACQNPYPGFWPGRTGGCALRRMILNPLVLTGTELGDQAALTFAIENYPGFPEGVGGAELGDLFQKQAERFGHALI